MALSGSSGLPLGREDRAAGRGIPPVANDVDGDRAAVPIARRGPGSAVPGGAAGGPVMRLVGDETDGPAITGTEIEAIAPAETADAEARGNPLAGEDFARAASVAAASSEAAAGIEAKASADEALAAAAYGALSAKYARPSDRKVEWVRGAVARYERPLTQYAVHVLGGDVERARDLVQEAFLRLCDQDEQTIGTHVAEWLYTVCRNLAIDQRRKDRRMRLMTEEQEAAFAAGNEGPTDAAERVDAYARVVDALAGLPARQQEIVRLKFQSGLSYKEIGEVMNLTATNVGFILHTAIKALRSRFGTDAARPRDDDEDVDPASNV